MAMDKNIFIIAETDRGLTTQETYELVSFAKGISSKVIPAIIVLGTHPEEPAGELAEKTGCTAIAVKGDHLELYNAQAYRDAIMEIIPADIPSWICLAHTSTGYDLAPHIAVKLNAALITGVESVQEGTSFRRSVCSGKFMTDIIPKTPSTVWGGHSARA